MLVGHVTLKYFARKFFFLSQRMVWRTHGSIVPLGFAPTEMAEIQAERGLPTHKLITVSLTTCGSRQKMIERFLEQEMAIIHVLGADKKSRHLVPTWKDLQGLESKNQAVKPLQDFTDALSGESYVSVSCIKPVLHLFEPWIRFFVRKKKHFFNHIAQP